MSASNTNASYGTVAKTFHWIVALMILSLIPMGMIANRLPFATSEELALKAWLFSMHKTLGVAVFFVAIARIGWALTQPKPAGLHPDAKSENFLAELVHWLLYGSLVLVPLSGWLHHAATTGFAPIWWPFGQGLPFVPKSESLAATMAGLHIVFERVLFLSILLHIAGALKHVIIDRDDTLRRMLPFGGDVAAPQEGAGHMWRAPLAVALAVWAGALGIGGALGVYGTHAGTADAVELEAVTSDWAVQSGEISIEVQQFGSAVTGSFADWTAEISFDPDTPSEIKGTVRTVISIASLTLGSVTDQALGADYFDAETHPTATFAADIHTMPDNAYEARGTLTIKDQAVPITLPFTLDITGDTAVMTGAVTVQRLDFGIGENMPDESSLGFAVGISVTVTAQQ